jgi:hypothetical protein
VNLPDIQAEGPPVSPIVLDHNLDHNVDRRVDFVIIVNSTSPASPNDRTAGQEARGCETGPDDPPDEEAASGAAGEALEDLAGERGMDNAEAVEPEPSAVATTLGAMARRRPTITELREDDCRWPVDLVVVAGEFSTGPKHVFCQNPRAPGRPYCTGHTVAAYATTKDRQTLVREAREARQRYEERRRLTGLGLRAALKG